MSQEITITKVEDHFEMRFDGGDAYPVPTTAIDKLDDDLTPSEVGESVTFRGEYKGTKHMKNFGVEEVLDTPGDDEEDTTDDADEGAEDSDEQSENVAEPTPEHVEGVGYNKAAGQAQQVEAQRLFSDGGEVGVEVEGGGQESGEAGESGDGQGDDSDHMFASDDSECRHVDCVASPEMAAECDTGQTKYYCEDHAGGRRAGHALVEKWRAMEQ